MVPKKSGSKRVSLGLKYKQLKRAKEHHRKLDKEKKRARKSGIGQGVKLKAKDPGIPNDYPGKADLLRQIEVAKVALEERKEAQKEARKDARKAALEARRGLVGVMGASSLYGLTEASAARGAAFMAASGVAAEMAAADEGAVAKSGEGQRSRRAFLKELRKVVETADVILEVRTA